jgi:hypothetical protein
MRWYGVPMLRCVNFLLAFVQRVEKFRPVGTIVEVFHAHGRSRRHGKSPSDFL